MSDEQRRRLSPEEQEAADWEQARQWAEGTPDWSDALWQKINVGLGYRVVTLDHAETREPSDDSRASGASD